MAAGPGHAPGLMGPLGLVTVPTARMDDSGTIRAQMAMTEPYAHASAGVQIASPLYIGIRQTARTDSLRRDAERLYPGVDVKLRLVPEGPYVPEIALGWQGAVGHKRMAGEYLVLSKRYEEWDFTAGMAWGRLGSAAHVGNPLKAIHKHFGRERALDGELPNGPADWFTGADIGFFAGVEYRTPWIDGLRLKAEWGADRYVAEQAAFGFDAPEPWAVGVSYSPFSWMDIGAGLIGGDRLMGRLSLQAPVKSWPGRSARTEKPPPYFPARTSVSTPDYLRMAAREQDIVLRDAGRDGAISWARVETDPYRPLPAQIGRAGRIMASHGGDEIAAVEVVPQLYGLHGPSVRLMRRELEQAFTRQGGSPQEIWRKTSFDTDATDRRETGFRPRLADLKKNTRFIWDTQTSLGEEDNGILYRTALVMETRQRLTRHLMAGSGLRFNLGGNLRDLNSARALPLLPVREDVDAFSNNIVNLDRAYIAGFKSFNTDLHAMFAAGYLEEMYAGAGGEILYRPFGKTFAIGAEAWQVFKRDPWSVMAEGMNGDHVLSGHINAWYEVPDSNLTFHARAGRYLAGDWGGTLALRHNFTHGGHIEAFATATNDADFDPFGGITHIYSGLRLTMPVGNIKYMNKGNEIRVTAAQMGRRSGQALDRPLPLYDMTDSFSLRQIARDWGGIAE